jgi:aspartyl-tRNA(Asn)/glutamyl-tRNA(Gln) amidotransferase subunit C
MEVTREDVLRCAQLTHVSLDEAEIEPLRRDMEQMLSHAQSLDRLDLEGVEPMTHAVDIPLPRREDIARPGFTQAEALAGAPQADRGCFLVPKVR